MHGVSGLSSPYQLPKTGRGNRDFSKFSFSHQSSTHEACMCILGCLMRVSHHISRRARTARFVNTITLHMRPVTPASRVVVGDRSHVSRPYSHKPQGSRQQAGSYGMSLVKT